MFNLFKIVPAKLFEIKYVTRDISGNFIECGWTKWGTIRATRHELEKREVLVKSYDK